jgi:hypothetical protein
MSDTTTTTFLTVETIATYGGASIAVMAASNTIRKIFNVDKVWVPFVLCLIVAYGGVYLVDEKIDLKNGIISFFNACLLFTSAAGLDHGLVKVVNGAPAGAKQLQGKSRIPWLSPWL